MATTFPAANPITGRSSNSRPVVTKIVSKFQITIPTEVREIYDLREGDLLEWSFNTQDGQLTVLPKRAQLITPQVVQEINDLKARRAKAKGTVPELTAAAVD